MSDLPPIAWYIIVANEIDDPNSNLYDIIQLKEAEEKMTSEEKEEALKIRAKNASYRNSQKRDLIG